MSAAGTVVRFFPFLFCVLDFTGHAVFGASVTPTPVSLPFISGSEFSDQVDQSQIPVVLDFWASWCAPCQVYSPVVEKVANAYKGKMAFYKVDVSDASNDQRVRSYSIESIPTILVIEKGQVVERWEGSFKLKDLKTKLNQVLKTWDKISALNP